MYYRRNQNEDPPPLVDPRVWLSLGLTGLVLLAMGLILKAADAADLRDITAKIAGLDDRRTSSLTELPVAENEYRSNAPKFASHHSEGFDTRLKNARTYLQEGGDVSMLQAKAQNELDSGNREQARSTWRSADEKLVFAKQIIDTLIHPPFYAVLQKKVDAVKGTYLRDSQEQIDIQRRYVTNMPTKNLCGTSSVLSYSSAMDVVNQAQIRLDTARATAKIVLPEGVVDYPLAYDQATDAVNTVGGASTMADSLSQQADGVASEIATADSRISHAAAKLTNSYDYSSAKSYHTQAVTARNNAVDACGRQDFGAASTYATSAVNFARLSSEASDPPTPTPTPEPTSTPRPTSEPDTSPNVTFEEDEEDVEYNYGGGYESESNNSYDDYDSDDGFSGSDGYDSDDGFSGSDGYDSDDGF